MLLQAIRPPTRSLQRVSCNPRGRGKGAWYELVQPPEIHNRPAFLTRRICGAQRQPPRESNKPRPAIRLHTANVIPSKLPEKHLLNVVDCFLFRFPLLLPILDPETTVDKIMDGILTNQSVIIIPRLLKLLLILKR